MVRVEAAAVLAGAIASEARRVVAQGAALAGTIRRRVQPPLALQPADRPVVGVHNGPVDVQARGQIVDDNACAVRQQAW